MSEPREPLALEAPIVRISASQIHTADLCLRKWAFKYIEKLPDPQTTDQAEGIALHKRNELWLRDGVHPGTDQTGQLIQAAIRPGMLPSPGKHLLVEHAFEIPLDQHSKFIGFIDVIEPPAQHTPQRVVVVDHKSCVSFRYALGKKELGEDPQGVAYGKAALDLFPKVTEIERRWLYFQKRSTKVLKVDNVADPVQIEESWAQLRAQALELVQLRLKAIPAAQLLGNREGCDAFRGCPYRGVCEEGKAGHKFALGKKDFTPKVNTFTFPTPQGGVNVMTTLQEQLKQLQAQAQGAMQAPLPTDVNPPAKPSTAMPASAAPPATAAPWQPAPAVLSQEAEWRAKKAAAKAAAEKALAEAEAMQPPAPPPAPAPVVEVAPTPPPAPIQPFANQVEVVAATAAPAGAMVAEAPEKQKGKKARAEKAAPASAAGQLSVLFSSAVVKHPGTQATPVHLVDLLSPIMRTVADENKVAHWSLIPFGQGKALLAHAFDKWMGTEQWKGTIIVGDSEEAWAVHEVLVAHADVVVRGTR